MFCSFGKSPRILRFFCEGRVVEWWEREFGVLLGRMRKAKGGMEGARAVVCLRVWKVGFFLCDFLFVGSFFFAVVCVVMILLYVEIYGHRVEDFYDLSLSIVH